MADGPGGIPGGREASSLPEATIEDYFSEERVFPALRGLPPPGCDRRSRASTVRLSPTGRDSGPNRPVPSTGSTPGTPCSSGIFRSPGGSTGGRSTCPTTASIGTSPRAAATRWRSTGRASRATPAPSPTASSSSMFPGSPMCCAAWASERGDRVADLHADDPRAAGGHAGLHPHRRCALGGVRWLLLRRPARQDPRRPGPGRGHRRRWLARGSPAALLKPNVDVAVDQTLCVDHVVVARRIGDEADDRMVDGQSAATTGGTS
jgi:hypothetical protein